MRGLSGQCVMSEWTPCLGWAGFMHLASHRCQREDQTFNVLMLPNAERCNFQPQHSQRAGDESLLTLTSTVPTTPVPSTIWQGDIVAQLQKGGDLTMDAGEGHAPTAAAAPCVIHPGCVSAECLWSADVGAISFYKLTLDSQLVGGGRGRGGSRSL